MLLRIVSKYGLATHLAIAAALPAAAAPFWDAVEIAKISFWLTALAVAWVLLEPSVRAGETPGAARARVRAHVLRDPLFWFFGVAFLFALVRYLNGGLELAYDSETATWKVAEPFFPVLPSAAASAALVPLAVAASVWVTVTGVSHAMGRSSRTWFALVCGCIGGAGGIAAVTCAMFGYAPLLKAASAGFGMPRIWGSLFAAFLPLTIAGGIHAEELNWKGSRLPFTVAVLGNAAGLFFFAPPFLAAIYVLCVSVYALFALFRLFRASGAGAAARSTVMVVFGFFGAFLLLALPPSVEIAGKKVEGLKMASAFPAERRECNEVFFRISKSMWLRQPWSGVGIGVFQMQVPFFADREDWRVIPPKPELPQNGYLALLTERGIAGCAVLAAGLILLFVRWLLRLWGGYRSIKDEPERHAFPFAVPPECWVFPVVCLPILVDLYFSPYFSMAVALPVVAGTCAGSAVAFPRLKTPKKEG